MLLNDYVTALIVELLMSELSEIELLEERQHVVVKAVDDRMFLRGITVS